MSRGSINKVILIGNLGSDPESRFTPNGVQVTNFNMATSENWTDRNGDRQERTEWHRVVLWRRLAEVAGQYLKKGSRVYIEGKLQTRNWEDPKGQRHQVTEIVASSMEMLSGANGPAEMDMDFGDGRNGRQAVSAGQARGEGRQAVPAGVDAGEDGLPF